MKKLLIILLIILFTVFLSGSFYEKVDSNLEIMNDSGLTDDISKETLEILKELGIDKISIDTLSDLSFEKIFKEIKNGFISNIKYPFYSVVSVFIVGIFSMILQNLGGFEENMKSLYNIVSTFAVSVSVIIPIKDIVVSSEKVIQECSDFMLSFIPIYSSALISSGYVSSGAGYRTLMLGAVTVISRISSNIIVPFVCIYLGMSIANSVSLVKFGQIAKYIKDFSTWSLGLLMALFSGILGIGTLVSSSVDQIGSKAIKFAVGSTVPIVGGAISDMLSTIKSCLLLSKDILGTYSIVIIAVIFLPIIIKIISWKIGLSVGTILGDLFDNKNISDIYNASSSVMGIILALILTVLIMMIFSVTIMFLTVRS